MKYVVLQLILLLFVSGTFSQSVSNVKFKQEGNNIEINYDLESESPIEISLYYSYDGGLSFGEELRNVSGDVGSGVVSGNEKEIIWDVLSSKKYLYGDNIVFKVEANINFIEMVFVEGGNFQMGSNSGMMDESPIHEVLLNDFYISKYEITQKQWKDLLINNPSHHKRNSDHKPVERISVEDIKLFILKLKEMTGENYRLPTEAEWEYAAKGGQYSHDYIYSGSNNIDSVAWYINNSHYTTQFGGLFLPNELGICDMTGNVWEICSDFYSTDYYSVCNKENPKGPQNGTNYVIRGGSAYTNKNKCTVTFRGSIAIKQKNRFIGFRLVKEVK